MPSGSVRCNKHDSRETEILGEPLDADRRECVMSVRWCDGQMERFHGRYEYIFIESICQDEEVLEQNYRYKMLYSPDYVGMDPSTVIHQRRRI